MVQLLQNCPNCRDIAYQPSLVSLLLFPFIRGSYHYYTLSLASPLEMYNNFVWSVFSQTEMDQWGWRLILSNF